MRTFVFATAGYFLLAVVLVFSPSGILAANHYVLPSPGGSLGTTGTDWSHACSEWTGNCAPASMVRGDTYYFGGGIYNAITINFNTSGTSPAIYLIGATAANSRSVAGWSSSYDVSVNQAVWRPGGCSSNFPGCVAVDLGTNYVLDGSVGDGLSNSTSAYGLYIAPPTAGLGYQQHLFTMVGNNNTVKHWALQCGGPTDNTEQEGIYYYSTNATTNIDLASFYITNCQTEINMNTNSSLWTVEHGRIGPDFSTFSHHGVNINAFMTSNSTVRYTIFDDCVVTGCIEANNSGVSINNWAIYGNLILAVGTGTGIIAGTSSGSSGGCVSNTVFYNNTVVNSTVPIFNQMNPGTTDCTGSGNVTRNNLLYNSACAQPTNGGGPVDKDYDTCLNAIDIPVSETHGQVASFNPFLNLDGSVPGGYALAQAGGTRANQVNLGLAIPGWSTAPSGCTAGVNCEDIDPNGVARSAPDRGAYEFVAAPQPPTNLTATPE